MLWDKTKNRKENKNLLWWRASKRQEFWYLLKIFVVMEWSQKTRVLISAQNICCDGELPKDKSFDICSKYLLWWRAPKRQEFWYLLKIFVVMECSQIFIVESFQKTRVFISALIIVKKIASKEICRWVVHSLHSKFRKIFIIAS